MTISSESISLTDFDWDLASEVYLESLNDKSMFPTLNFIFQQLLIAETGKTQT